VSDCCDCCAAAGTCYYHKKKKSRLIGDSADYPVLTAAQWKEIYKHEIPTDPAALDAMASGEALL
jgi:hypothetical protein